MRDALTCQTDEELARHARAGSLAAFDELARRLQGPLLRFLRRRFPSRRDAEDLVQESLLQAYRSLGRYDGRRPFRAWAFTIAYRLSVSRGRGQRPAVELRDAADARETPAAAAEQREERGRLWSIARRELTDEQFAALWLHYVEDLPATDVARVMGRSWVSVKTMLHRARRKLLPHLADKEPMIHSIGPFGGVR